VSDFLKRLILVLVVIYAPNKVYIEVIVIYCAYVRPHLEYAAVVWSTPSKKDAKMLELVQRRATKLVPRIRNWRYEDHLAVLRLTSLNERRVRGDLIQDTYDVLIFSCQKT